MFYLGGKSSVYTLTCEIFNFPDDKTLDTEKVDKSEEEKYERNVFYFQFSCLKICLP